MGIHTRWEPTVTTLGPTAKVGMTIALVFPILVCGLGLMSASDHLANVFLVVPLSAFAIVAAVVLRDVWEPGQRQAGFATRGGVRRRRR